MKTNKQMWNLMNILYIYITFHEIQQMSGELWHKKHQPKPYPVHDLLGFTSRFDTRNGCHFFSPRAKRQKARCVRAVRRSELDVVIRCDKGNSWKHNMYNIYIYI